MLPHTILSPHDANSECDRFHWWSSIRFAKESKVWSSNCSWRAQRPPKPIRVLGKMGVVSLVPGLLNPAFVAFSTNVGKVW